jgi:FMNH2-dependent dimethyl sulfone monooxygenase
LAADISYNALQQILRGKREMKFGFWLPIFGGWLRNVEDENMPPTFDYAKKVIQQAEQLGFDTTLIA